jgi:hypothetical protein
MPPAEIRFCHLIELLSLTCMLPFSCMDSTTHFLRFVRNCGNTGASQTTGLSEPVQRSRISRRGMYPLFRWMSDARKIVGSHDTHQFVNAVLAIASYRHLGPGGNRIDPLHIVEVVRSREALSARAVAEPPALLQRVHLRHRVRCGANRYLPRRFAQTHGYSRRMIHPLHVR